MLLELSHITISRAVRILICSGRFLGIALVTAYWINDIWGCCYQSNIVSSWLVNDTEQSTLKMIKVNYFCGRPKKKKIKNYFS